MTAFQVDQGGLGPYQYTNILGLSGQAGSASCIAWQVQIYFFNTWTIVPITIATLTLLFFQLAYITMNVISCQTLDCENFSGYGMAG